MNNDDLVRGLQRRADEIFLTSPTSRVADLLDRISKIINAGETYEDRQHLRLAVMRTTSAEGQRDTDRESS